MRRGGVRYCQGCDEPPRHIKDRTRSELRLRFYSVRLDKESSTKSGIFVCGSIKVLNGAGLIRCP